MNRYFYPGTTFTTSGTLASTNDLFFKGGYQAAADGAVLRAIGHAENLGHIFLEGADAASTTGATLLAAGVLTNAGYLRVGGSNYSGSALLAIENSVTNSGTISVNYGILGDGGQLLIAAGATLTSAPDSNALLTLQARSFEGMGSATLTDSGVLINGAGDTINVDGAAASYYDGAQLLVAGTLQNGGTLNVVSAQIFREDFYFTPMNSGTINVSGVLQNTGLVQIGGSEGFRGAYGGDGVLLDSGTITNEGSITIAGFGGGSAYCGTLDVTGVLENSGNIFLDPGANEISYGVAIGQLIDAGVMTNSGTLTLGGAQLNYVYQGSAATIFGVLTNTNAIAIQQDGTLTIEGPGSLVNMAGLTVNGGAGSAYSSAETAGGLDVEGSMENSGSLNFGGGLSGFDKPGYAYGGAGAQITVAGVFTNSGTVSGGGGSGGYRYFGGTEYYGTGATVTVSGLMTNAGLTELLAGTRSYAGLYGTGATLIDSGTLTNAGTIIVDGGPGIASALLTVTSAGTLANTGTIEGTGTIDNAGLLIASGTISASTLSNVGTLAIIANSALTIGSAITADATHPGVVDIAAHATLTLAGSVAANQEIAFAGPGVTLVLAYPSAFAGSLGGFAPGDTIDLANLHLIAASAFGGTLDLTLANGATFDLRLDAPLSAPALTLAADGHGGTDLLLTPSSHALPPRSDNAALYLQHLAPASPDHPFA
jgi:hypothetical protein